MGMSTKQGVYHEVLASFVGEIPHAKGWWYWLPSRVALGFPKDKPTVIWKKYKNKERKKHPTAINCRASSQIMREELVKIIKGLNMFLDVLKGQVGSCVEVNGIFTAHGSNSKQISSSADNESVVERQL
jgi:hypothetical protein